MGASIIVSTLVWCILSFGCTGGRDIPEEVRITVVPGIHLGMKEEVFLEKCRELNSRGLFTNSYDNRSIHYAMKSGLPAEARFTFTPLFDSHSLIQVDASAFYVGFAPWNRRLFSDSLLEDVKAFLLLQNGGKPFESRNAGYAKQIWVKNDDFAKIELWREDERLINIRYKQVAEK